MPDNSVRNHVVRDVPKLLWGDQETYTDDLMVISALRTVLDHMGMKYSKAYLAGVSAAAFDAGWLCTSVSTGADGAIYAYSNHFERGIENAFRAIGRECQITYRTVGEALWGQSVQSIDRGRPLVALESPLKSPLDHFAVIAGYDRQQKTFLARRYGTPKETPDAYVPLTVDDVAWILTVGEPAPKSSPAGAFRNSLHIAVTNAKAGPNSPATRHGGKPYPLVYGPQVFKEHARIIPEQLDPGGPGYDWKEHVLIWRLDALSLARAYAVEYLQENQDLLGPQAAQHIHLAVQKYCQVLGLLASCNIKGGTPPTEIRGMEIAVQPAHIRLLGPEERIAWVEDGVARPMAQFLSTVRNRQRLAEWHLHIGALEEGAIQEIEKALAAAE